MKRITAAVIIIVLITSCCIFSLMFTFNQKGKFSTLISNACDYVEKNDIESAREQVKKFEKEWDSKEKIMKLVVHRKDLDEITFNCRMLNEYLKSKDTSEFNAEAKKILALLDHTFDTEVPILSNIF